MMREKIRSNGHAGHASFEDEIAIVHPLDVSNDASLVEFDLSAEEIEPLIGRDLFTEFDVIESGKSDEANVGIAFINHKRGDLSSGLDHEDTGEQGASGDMPGDPEFIGASVFVTDGHAEFVIGPDNAVKHTHMAALRIDCFDILHAKGELVQIDLTDIKDKSWSHE